MSKNYQNARHNLWLLEKDNVRLLDVVTGYESELVDLRKNELLWDTGVVKFKEQLACVQENAEYWEDQYETLEEELLQQALATATACCKVQNLEADIKNLRLSNAMPAFHGYIEQEHKINSLTHQLAETKEDVAKVETHLCDADFEIGRLQGVIINKDNKYGNLLAENIKLKEEFKAAMSFENLFKELARG